MVIIRIVKQDDLKNLDEIYLKSYNSLNIGENWDIQSSQKLMEFFFSYQSDLFFLAEVDGIIAGAIVALVKPWWDGNHLVDGEIFINPKFQKQGLGTKLIEKMFLIAKEKYQAVSWDTFTHIIYEHPLKWYKKLGFTKINQWTMISGDTSKVLNKIQEQSKKRL